MIIASTIMVGLSLIWLIFWIRKCEKDRAKYRNELNKSFDEVYELGVEKGVMLGCDIVFSALYKMHKEDKLLDFNSLYCSINDELSEFYDHSEVASKWQEEYQQHMTNKYIPEIYESSFENDVINAEEETEQF